MKNSSLFFLLFCLNNILTAQEISTARGGEIYFPKESNCLTDNQRSAVKSMLQQNIAQLSQEGILSSALSFKSVTVSFDWPLRKTNGLSFNSYYAVNNFVDHNPGPGLLDYHCDARTYNGHRGIDIDTWPFPWYIYNNNFVEVVAGAAGTIIGKMDGNEDNHCSCSGNWNAVFIQHADGSTAWYGHLKKNTLTTKNIGQSVAKGEYLGVVASSGCSTQPHLHFEVYDSANNLIDPYIGSCNSLNTNPWWTVQPSNREPTLNALLTHHAVPIHGCPSDNEQPNISNTFTPGQLVYMATYYHDQLVGDVSNLKIRKPDNTIWQSWSHTSNNTYTKSWWYWSWNLPVGGPFGTWKFEVEYKGQTFQHQFQYQAATVNRKPTAFDDNANTNEDTPITECVVNNDNDPDNDPLVGGVMIISNGDHGTASLNTFTGCITYTPNTSFAGVDSIQYKVCDPGGLCDTAYLIITVVRKCAVIETWLYLEGAAVATDGSTNYSLPMRTTLNNLGLLPGQTYNDFFLGTLYTPAGQPYHTAPWNYPGREGDGYDSNGMLANAKANYPGTVMDWVLVSLRETVNGTGGPACQAAALLHKDGRVEFINGFKCCGINLTKSYYIVIEHRNHLIVMSHVPVAVVGGKISYDFRNKQSYINDPFGFNTFSGQKQILPGVYAMFAGNGNQTLTTASDTDTNFDDRTFWESLNSQIAKYRSGDYNLNGDTNFNDRRAWELNNGKFTSVPRN